MPGVTPKGAQCCRRRWQQQRSSPEKLGQQRLHAGDRDLIGILYSYAFDSPTAMRAYDDQRKIFTYVP